MTNYLNNRIGSGYGIRLSKEGRNRHFRLEWSSVEIELENGEVVEVKLSNSFWRGCVELRSSKIGRWMLEKGYAPLSPFTILIREKEPMVVKL